MMKPQAKEKPLPNLPDWDEHQRLAYEKEILGFFITGHPLEKYRDKLLDFHALTTAEIADLKSSTGKDDTLVGGVLKGIRVAKSKKGDLYATGQLEDMNGSVDILCFAEAYRRLGEKLKLDVPVLVKGGVSRGRFQHQDSRRRHHPARTGSAQASAQPAHQDSPGERRREHRLRSSRSMPGAQRRSEGAVRPGTQG